ncbi:hypothetical protein HMPREF1567_0924 [Providencia alcalifaciens PAL-2]|nr:hypothetical protein HMPREF1567_0924 [Providencia alcalifaciens PAL-2]
MAFLATLQEASLSNSCELIEAKSVSAKGAAYIAKINTHI